MKLRLSRNEIPNHLLRFFRPVGHKPKDLVNIPSLVAEALREQGWWLRSDIAWIKRACMPESVTDRPTSAWEHIWLLTKSARYFYDSEAVKEEAIHEGRVVAATGNGSKNAASPDDVNDRRTAVGFTKHDTVVTGRQQRNYWLLSPEPNGLQHFATFPTEIPRRCILAGSPERCCPTCGKGWVRVVEKERHAGSSPNRNDGLSARYDGCSLRRDASNGRSHSVVLAEQWKPGCTCPDNDGSGRAVVLDPFGGAGTVGLVADRLGRDAILCELNPEYARMAEERIKGDAPLFADVSSTG